MADITHELHWDDSMDFNIEDYPRLLQYEENGEAKAGLPTLVFTGRIEGFTTPLQKNKE